MKKPISPKRAANVVSIILLLLVIFQVLLIVGLPLGIAAYGGKYETLPANLRSVSASTIVVYLLTIYVLRTRAGLTKGKKDDSFIVTMTWVATAVFAFSTVANIISASQYENFLMAPLAFICAVASYIIAKSK